MSEIDSLQNGNINTPGLNWPDGQLLPAFSSPAEILDILDIISASNAEKTLFSTLKGLINRAKPRIYTYEDETYPKHEWLEKMNLGYADVSDNWSIIAKYRSEINGIVIYDPKQADTINLATVIAGLKNGIVADPSLAERLTSAPYNFQVLEDLRGRFKNNINVYEYAYDNYWPQLTHRVIVSLRPSIASYLREYAISIRAMMIWLDPRIPSEDALLRKFLSDMPGGTSLCLGWWAEEQSGVKRGSEYGVVTVASDFSTNLSVYGGLPKAINIKPVPPKPELRNKIYLTFIISDGDNIQYMERGMLKLWNDPNRGKVPLGWTVSPLLLDAAPAIFNWYCQTASENDCLISGPSGAGYFYPNIWNNRSHLEKFLRTSDYYCNKTGIKAITVWNGGWAEISEESRRAYADCMPSLLGITSLSQGKGGPARVYDGKFACINLAADYIGDAKDLQKAIDRHSKGWDGNSPLFLAVQAIAWKLHPTDIMNIVNSLDSKFEVVRTDTFFELALEDANR